MINLVDYIVNEETLRGFLLFLDKLNQWNDAFLQVLNQPLLIDNIVLRNLVILLVNLLERTPNELVEPTVTQLFKLRRYFFLFLSCEPY